VTDSFKALIFDCDGVLAETERDGHRVAFNVVSRKKPDPEIYRLAMARLGVESSQCAVVEDNRNGLLAAHGAGMVCVVTTNGYTEDEDFSEADLVVPELGDTPNVRVTLEAIRNLVEGG
jgi:beta-phosphoglucomutase-like phosphatase (HAD superfamily)